MFHQILNLRTEAEHAVMGLGKRVGSAREALNILYRRPILEASELAAALDISIPTANSLIKALIDKNILIEVTGQQRGRVYAFERYLKLFVS